MTAKQTKVKIYTGSALRVSRWLSAHCEVQTTIHFSLAARYSQEPIIIAVTKDVLKCFYKLFY